MNEAAKESSKHKQNLSQTELDFITILQNKLAKNDENVYIIVEQCEYDIRSISTLEANLDAKFSSQFNKLSDKIGDL